MSTQAVQYAFSSSLGPSGYIPGQFYFPTRVAVNNTGYVFVADQSRYSIQIFDPSGDWKQTIGGNGPNIHGEGAGNGQFMEMTGIAVNNTGYIFVGDLGRIQIFDPSGDWKQTIGGSGISYTSDSAGNGQFHFPPRSVSRINGQFYFVSGIAVDNTGNIFAADQDNNRIQIFDPSGNWKQTIYENGIDYHTDYWLQPHFGWPQDIAVNNTGYLFAADPFDSRSIQIFSNTASHSIHRISNATLTSHQIMKNPYSGAITTPIVIGIKNLVTINPFSIGKVSGPCPSGALSKLTGGSLGATLVDCFSIQQNLFIKISGQTQSAYWTQNVIQVGTDKAGKTYAAPGYNIFDPSGQLLAASSQVEIFHQITTPITFDIESTISNNQLYLKNDYQSYSFSLPPNSYIGVNNNICNSNPPPKNDESPQLDIVGPDMGEDTYFSSGGGQVQSYVMLRGSQLQWSNAVIQQSLNNFGCEKTGEASYNLQWATNDNNTNLSNFTTIRGIDDQGVGFIPSTLLVEQYSTSSNQNISASVSGLQTQSSLQVTFTESGLQQRCWFWIFGCSLPSWSITLDGNAETSTSTSITFGNMNSGTYSYSVNIPSGYSTPSTNKLQVNGNMNQIVNFVKNQ